MKKIFYLILFFPVLSWANKPSSEIPERREFPLSESVSPCEDFYEYTCSEVNKSFKLREDRSRHIFSFSDSSERLLEKKKNYLQNLSKQEKRSVGEEELNDVFLACMNTIQRTVDERGEVQRIFSEVNRIKDRESFKKFLGKKNLSSDFSFFDFGTPPNQQKPLWNDLSIVADVRTLPERSYYEDKKTLKAFEKLAKSFYTSIGVKEASKMARYLVDFEKEFDKSFPQPSEWRTIWTTPSEISREKLLSDYKDFYLDELLSKVPKKTLIRDFTPENFKFMKRALNEYPLDQLKAVYLFHALSPVMDNAYPHYYKMKFAFNKKYLGGPNQRPDLKERCTKYVMGSFMKEIDYELYPKLFGDFSKKKFVKLVDKVRASLLDGIEKNKWLSAEGKKSAKKKMKKAFLQVVKPNNKKEWDFPYKADYSPKHYLANQKLRAQKSNEKGLDSLRKKQNNKAWGWGPLVVNAYYSPSENKFVMPVGILQYPFYDQELPEHVNLGAVGTVVGHELGHGIDDKGAQFDYKGRLKQWMTKEDLEEFKKRGASLVAQFNEIGHNGELTLGENIGDLVGLTASYNAAFPNGKGDIEKKKDFFVQYGRAWCGVMRDGARKLLLKTDSHSLVDARVNQQVIHQPGFYDAFKCKKGDKMFLSKEERVKIW